jgi:hypothetical protein
MFWSNIELLLRRCTVDKMITWNITEMKIKWSVSGFTLKLTLTAYRTTLINQSPWISITDQF